MGWQEDFFGNVKIYKNAKSRNTALKAKSTRDKKKDAEKRYYDQQLTRASQSLASKAGVKFDANFKQATESYLKNQKVREDFRQDSIKLSNKREKAELKSHASFKDPGGYQTKRYNEMRKSIGLNEDKMITKKKFADIQATFDRMNRFKKNQPTSSKGVGFSIKKVDKTIDKGVSGISNFIDKYAPGVKKGVKEIANSKVVKTVGKGLDKIDQYTLAPLKNIAETNTEALKEADKQIKDGKKLKSMSYSEALKGAKKDFSDAYSNKRRSTMEEARKNANISTGSKYLDKTLDFAVESTVDPLNLIGVGVGAKAVKGLGKLKKGNKVVEEINAAEKSKPLLLDAPKPGAKFENAKVIEPKLQQVIEKLPKKEPTTLNIDVPSVTKRKISHRREPNGVLIAEGLLKKPNLERPKKVDYAKQKQELEFIRQADKEQFAKQNNDVIQVVTAERKKALEDQIRQETEFDGHVEMAKQYDQIMKSVGGRLNIPSDNHADFATQLGKHMYSAKGKGAGDDIYRVAEDLGYNNPDELIQHLNNGYASKQITKAGKSKYVTAKMSGDPDSVLDELYGQTKNGQQFQRDIDEMDRLHNQEPEYLNIDAEPTTARMVRSPKEPLIMPQSNAKLGDIVNDGYFPDGPKNKQQMNFEKGQVEPVQLTNVEKTKQRSDQLVNDLDSDNWNNKSSFGLNRETADRNADEIFGKDAQVMKDTYFEPIKQNEAERIKYLRGIKDTTDKMYKSFKLSKKDDQLIQKFGEGKISIDDLKKETKNWQNVEKAVNWYRSYYDDVINQLNDSLTRNGFDPIPKLENYFPHYNDEGNFLKDIFGIDKTNHELPTDINGLTEHFRPQKNFFGNAMKRTGDKTSFGALQGLSQYIEGASNLIYHTDNIRNIRSLEESIRKKYPGEGHLNNITKWLKEYGDQLAGKKGVLDRGPEGVFGRGVYNTAKTLQNNIGKAFTSYNVGSALTGFIPGIFAASQTGKVALTKALFETLQNTIKNDGFVDSSPFLTRRMGADPLHMTKFQKFSDKGYWMMKQIDNFNANVIVRGKYNELIGKGLSHDEAIKKADDFAARVMADRSKGQMPLLFNQKTLGPITQFQLEINNQLSHIMKDMPKNALSKSNNKGKQALHVASAFGQMAIYGWAFNELYEKVTGRRPALDPIDYTMTFYKSLHGDAKATDVVKDVTGQIPFTSLFVGGRIPIDAAIPNVPDIMKQVGQSDGSWSEIGKVFGKEALEKTPYLAVPGYAQYKKTKDSAKALNEEVPGVYTDSGNLKYLVGDDLPNKLKGLTFGPGAFRETGEYYDNNRRMLGEKQTYNVVNSPNPKEAYNQEMIKRVDNNLKKLQKQPITKESDKKMQKLMEQLKKMRGE